MCVRSLDLGGHLSASNGEADEKADIDPCGHRLCRPCGARGGHREAARRAGRTASCGPEWEEHDRRVLGKEAGKSEEEEICDQPQFVGRIGFAARRIQQGAGATSPFMIGLGARQTTRPC